MKNSSSFLKKALTAGAAAGMLSSVQACVQNRTFAAASSDGFTYVNIQGTSVPYSVYSYFSTSRASGVFYYSGMPWLGVVSNGRLIRCTPLLGYTSQEIVEIVHTLRVREAQIFYEGWFIGRQGGPPTYRPGQPERPRPPSYAPPAQPPDQRPPGEQPPRDRPGTGPSPGDSIRIELRYRGPVCRNQYDDVIISDVDAVLGAISTDTSRMHPYDAGGGRIQVYRMNPRGVEELAATIDTRPYENDLTESALVDRALRSLEGGRVIPAGTAGRVSYSSRTARPRRDCRQ